MHPHRSSALHGAAAALTVALRRVVAMPLSWSWSHQPQGRACAAAPAHVDIKGRTPYTLHPRVIGGDQTIELNPSRTAFSIFSVF